MANTRTLHVRVKESIIATCAGSVHARLSFIDKVKDSKLHEFIRKLMMKPGEPWAETPGVPTPENGHRGHRVWQEIIVIAEEVLEE